MEEDYVKRQVEARQKAAVVKTEFLNFRSRFPEGPVVAVEGHDDKIVISYWISQVTPELGFEFFVCKGKGRVRKLVNSLQADRSGMGKNVSFIVDRDFDDLEGFSDFGPLLMLERYSVENYVVDREVVSKTIAVAFPGSGDPTCRERICDIFEKDYRDFLALTKELNRRIFLARKLKVEIDDAMPNSLSKLAVVELGTIESTTPPAESYLPDSVLNRNELLEALSGEFDQLDASTRYRGKFAYKFLCGWIDRLAAEFRSNKIGLFPPSDSCVEKVRHCEFSLGSYASKAKRPEKFDEFIRYVASS